MNAQCPSCHRLIYNRRLPRCGYCGAAIPEELQFSAEETVRLDRETARLRQEHQTRMAQRAKDEAEGKPASGDGTLL